MFPPSLDHLQGVHINYICMKSRRELIKLIKFACDKDSFTLPCVEFYPHICNGSSTCCPVCQFVFGLHTSAICMRDDAQSFVTRRL